jgi:5,10-methylenetetrahydrofolate reductase
MIVDRIQRQHSLTAVAHLTCVNATQREIGEILAQRPWAYQHFGSRGDPPGGIGEFKG